MNNLESFVAGSNPKVISSSDRRGGPRVVVDWSLNGLRFVCPSFEEFTARAINFSWGGACILVSKSLMVGDVISASTSVALSDPLTNQSVAFVFVACVRHVTYSNADGDYVVGLEILEFSGNGHWMVPELDDLASDRLRQTSAR